MKDEKDAKSEKRERQREGGRVAMADYLRRQLDVQDRTALLRPQRLARDANRQSDT